MILALDIATTTGVAFGAPTDRPAAWSFTVSGDHAARYAELARTINRLCKDRRPELVAFEAPFVGPRVSAARYLFGARGVVMGIVGMWQIPMLEVTVADVRKHFIGTAGWRGKEGKQRVQERCGQLGWGYENADEADALAVWDYAASRMSPEHSKKTMRIFDNAQSTDGKRNAEGAA